jgi:hypothetical protein
VAEAWLTQWCASSWQEPRNANVTRAAVYQTPAGQSADLAAGDDPSVWAQVVAQRVDQRCDQVHAQVSDEAPRSDARVRVVVAARRVTLAAGRPVQADQVSSTRRVIRQPEGRWLVDVADRAG